MSSPKPGKSKKGFSIVSISRRRRSLKKESDSLDLDSSSVRSAEAQEPLSPLPANVESLKMAAEIEDLTRQLAETRGEAD